MQPPDIRTLPLQKASCHTFLKERGSQISHAPKKRGGLLHAVRQQQNALFAQVLYLVLSFSAVQRNLYLAEAESRRNLRRIVHYHLRAARVPQVEYSVVWQGKYEHKKEWNWEFEKH